MAKRQLTPDVVKGLMIVLVVFSHLTHIGTQAKTLVDITAFFYSFHMPIFLFVSGFFFRPFSPPVEMLRKMTSRIVRPYLIFISLYLIAMMLAVHFLGARVNNHPPESIRDFLSTVFLHPSGSFWFLHTLVLIQGSFILARFVTLRIAKDHGELLWILAIGLMVIVCASGRIDLRTHHVLYFVAGMVTARVMESLPSGILIGSMLCVVFLVFFYTSILSFSANQFAWCLALLTLLGGLSARFADSALIGSLAWLGRNTMSILVLHALFVVSYKPLGRVFLQFDPSGLTFMAMNMITIVPLCLITSVGVDKLKLSHLLFGTPRVYSPRHDA